MKKERLDVVGEKFSGETQQTKLFRAKQQEVEIDKKYTTHQWIDNFKQSNIWALGNLLIFR